MTDAERLYRAQVDRRLREAVQSWLSEWDCQRYEDPETAFKDMMEMVGDWAHQWIKDNWTEVQP